MNKYVNKIINGDCLEIMTKIPDKSIDMILCDLPYGTTACKWDIVIPFEPLWQQYERIIKDDGAILLFGSQPFTSLLTQSNLKLFRYEWIYQKRVASNFAQAKKQPLKEHENVCVFYKKPPVYNPIKEPRKGSGLARLKSGYKSNSVSGEFNNHIKGNRTKITYEDLKYPSSVQEFNNREKDRGLHPTQKPVALYEYLIKTYTNEGDVVLDNCSGSGTCAIACLNTNRKFICIEKDYNYWKASCERIER